MQVDLEKLIETRRFRETYYSTLIQENAHDPTGLFKVVNRLLQRKSEIATRLVKRFMDFFFSKIDHIRRRIESGRDDNSLPADLSVECRTCMPTFEPLSDTQVLNLIKGRK